MFKLVVFSCSSSIFLIHNFLSHIVVRVSEKACALFSGPLILTAITNWIYPNYYTLTPPPKKNPLKRSHNVWHLRLPRVSLFSKITHEREHSKQASKGNYTTATIRDLLAAAALPRPSRPRQTPSKESTRQTLSIGPSKLTTTGKRTKTDTRMCKNSSPPPSGSQKRTFLGNPLAEKEDSVDE